MAKTRLSDDIFHDLKNKIIAGTYKINESLLDENEAKAYEAMKTHLSRVETLITMRNEDKSQRTEAKQRKGSSEEEEEI